MRSAIVSETALLQDTGVVHARESLEMAFDGLFLQRTAQTAQPLYAQICRTDLPSEEMVEKQRSLSSPACNAATARTPGTAGEAQDHCQCANEPPSSPSEFLRLPVVCIKHPARC